MSLVKSGDCFNREWGGGEREEGKRCQITKPLPAVHRRQHVYRYILPGPATGAVEGVEGAPHFRPSKGRAFGNLPSGKFHALQRPVFTREKKVLVIVRITSIVSFVISFKSLIKVVCFIERLPMMIFAESAVVVSFEEILL